MALNFNKLTNQIRSMSDVAAQRQDTSSKLIDDLMQKLNRYASDFDHIDLSLRRVLSLTSDVENRVDLQKYRAARPLWTTEPLNQGYNASPNVPPQATIIAIDGSQALPSRHDAYAYYLINVGWIIYQHGSGMAPLEDSDPKLHYLGDGETEDILEFRSNLVSIQRDMSEIGQLSDTVWENRTSPAPILAILDQRLQYFPIGVNDSRESAQFVDTWIRGMTKIRDSGAYLAGYIDRPETGAIITLLNTLDIDQPKFNVKTLSDRPHLSDRVIFSRLLKPGQRSTVFEVVNQSTNYAPFRESNQEISFFYFKPPKSNGISRVDVPTWAAQQPDTIETIHTLLLEQCKLLGDYPYVLTRADEIAVVRRSDQEYLDHLVSIEMARKGLKQTVTGKGQGKNATRSARSRHTI